MMTTMFINVRRPSGAGRFYCVSSGGSAPALRFASRLRLAPG